MKKLPRHFYNRPTVTVAKELLGKYLVHEFEGIKRVGKIVEVEAYLGSHDLAAHSSKGITNRTKIMFGPPGYAYIYLIYGIHNCMNVVTEEEGKGCAILIRALEPIENITENTKGPGLLCKAMRINRKHTGQDLCASILYIVEETNPQPFKMAKSPRIGVAYAKHWARRHLRFYIKNNPFLSGVRHR